MLALRQVDKENLCAVSNDLEECLLKKDHLSFWKTWHAPVCIVLVIMMTQRTCLLHVLRKFVHLIVQDRMKHYVWILNRHIEYVNKNASRNDDNEIISIELVDNCIRKLKCNKLELKVLMTLRQNIFFMHTQWQFVCQKFCLMVYYKFYNMVTFHTDLNLV